MPELLAIFDVDGTLADSQGVIHATMSSAFKRAGLEPPDRSAVLSRVGLSLNRMVSELVGHDGGTHEEIVVGYRLAYLEAMEAGEEAPLFPGVQDGLRQLHQAGVTLGLATGKSKRGIDRMIETYGWSDLFATVQCADFHPSKPDPSMVRRALLETATDPTDAVVIGDTSFDIEMARRAEVPAIAVDWGYHPVERLADAGAKVILSSFDSLVDRIQRMAR
ncbi:MAG: HAD-IA family hydrolase [Pseudomonadota bacterium]